jgi:RND family efflux transporter MFP subunit
LQDASTAVEAARAALKSAEFTRDHAVIAAPADGRILRRLAEPDEMAEAGHTILVFASDQDGWIVRAGIAGSDVLRLEVGDDADVVVDGTTASVFKARVTQISEAAEAATRTTEVELSLESVPEGARSGFVVRTVIKPRPVAERPVVPASALIEGAGDKARLFLVGVNGSLAKRVEVEMAGIDGQRVFLKTPLPREASVVVSGAEYLRDGGTFELTTH